MSTPNRRLSSLRAWLASLRSRLATVQAHLRTVPLVSSRSRSGFSELVATALTLLWAVPQARGLFAAARPASSFDDRAIGLALYVGVDASHYTSHYVKTIAAAVGLWLLLYVLLRRWEGAMAVGSRWRIPLRDRHLVALFAAFAVLCHALVLVRPWDSFLATGRLLCLAALLALIRGMLAMPALRNRLPGGLRMWTDGLLTWRMLPGALLLLLFSWPFLVATVAAVEPILDLRTSSLLTVLALLGCAALGRSILGRETPGLNETRLLASLTPFLWLPAVLIGANELQYRWSGASVHGIARWFLLPLALAAAYWWLRPPRRSPRWWMSAVFLPSSVLQLALVRLHSHEYRVETIDVFHRGEQALPTHQLFTFGKIPFLDLRPVHSLSDMFFQSLYALVHGRGAAGADTLVWFEWMPAVLTMVLLYYLLRPLLSPLGAFLLVVALPASTVLSSYDSMVAVVAIALISTLRQPSRLRYLGLVGSLAALGLWRIDFGLAALPALLGVLALHLIFSQRAGRELAWFLRGGVVVVAGLVVSTLAAALLASRPLWQSLGLFANSYLVRSSTRARPNLYSGEFDIWVFLQYALLPAFGVTVVLWFVTRTLLRGRPPHPGACAVAFLVAYSLVLSTRSLERHTLVEGFRPYLFFLVLVLLPVLARPWRRTAWTLCAVLSLLGLRLVLTAPPLNAAIGQTSTAHLAPPVGTPLFDVRTWKRGDPRTVVLEPEYARLLRFLTNNLEADETFFDFSESPLLYVLANREFPTYLIPNLEHTGEYPQTRALEDLERLRLEGRLPLVVFRRGTHNDFGGNGGPAEVRMQRIAEWIYRHYQPEAVLGRYDLWAEPGRETVREDPHYPLRLRRHPELLRVQELPRSPEEPFEYQALDEDPYIQRVLNWAEAPPEERHPSWALRLRLASSVDGSFEIFWRHGDLPWSLENRVAVPVMGSGAVTSYDDLEMLDVTFRIDRSLEGESLVSVRIDPPPGAKFVIDSAELVGVETFSARKDVPQFHDLMMLPWAFANLDSTLDLAELEPVGRPLVKDQRLSRDAPILLCRPDEASPWQANHLLIRGRWNAQASPGIPVGSTDIRPPHLRPPSRGRIYGTFETDDLCCGFALDLQARPAAPIRSESYLVPLTSLWQWIGTDRPILLQSNVDFEIESVQYVHVER